MDFSPPIIPDVQKNLLAFSRVDAKSITLPCRASKWQALARTGEFVTIRENRLQLGGTMHASYSDFFVRIGILGQVGRFRAVDRQQYERGTHVICRTRRGLERGVVLSPASENIAFSVEESETPDGALVRRQTETDRLLIARLEMNRQEAYDACVRLLDQHGLQASLMDVEHLFDGRSLYFYFFGKVSTEVDVLTQQLAEAYDTEVQFRAFSDAMETGCGPECGTEDGNGCGSDCQGCAVASACK